MISKTFPAYIIMSSNWWFMYQTMHKPIWEFIFKNLVGTHGAVEISVSKMAFSLDVTKPHCLSSSLMDEDFML